MSDDKINIEDSEGIKAEQKAQAKAGVAAANAAVSADSAAVELTGGNRPIDDVIQKSQGDLIKVRQIINQGGFSGTEKDKYTISLHHAEWVEARNTYIDCDDNVEKKSVGYTALVNGKAQSHEIIKAHKEWEEVRNKCKNSGNVVTEKAKQYIETDRRVRANKKAESEIYPSIQGFQIRREGVKEGFDFYDRQDQLIDNTSIGTSPNQVPRYNARLPLYLDKNTSSILATADGKTTLPWTDYYVNCDQQATETDRTTCRNAVDKKNDYIVAINREFQRANDLLNIYYNVTAKKDTQTVTLLEEADVKAIIENQNKNIALMKQNALYDYDEYNSLAFYEDLVFFLYYALFIMFVFISLREYFSSSSYNYKNIAILILLGTYPKFILPAVLWLLNALTKVSEMLGLKNIRFWN
jgi:hypothetical protein